ncbi:FMNH2-dependent monooxygenase [Frondihabitans sp. PAMC 28766]|uniref:LLM class flavin-dependent oxidoreductase n=1 Tax=Frondihabitans sp. PAMC 28766 TaxID=1795630 RepID=UPI00078C84A0|nr:LLM class flavin-dependent oxidoreductase [Frondihabitans sp. PAMC 28766]AMM21395.1 FMNH2-dependent monooxygenase [Frondihabitans sp. PAMC 28766]
MTENVVIAVALAGAGWHPAAWREESASPEKITRLPYWRGLIGRAERGGVDFVTLEDSFLLQGGSITAGGSPDEHRVGGRLDALLIASAVAPSTSRIGLIPTVTTTHTEPFHVATGLQTLDHASRGRGGWRVQASPLAEEAALFGRRTIEPLDREDLAGPEAQALIADLFGEAADVIEVVRRLWDSWEDDAVIREVATGRYLDRDRIHNVEFEGEWFSVSGASIVPRPPQGQLPVTLLAHQDKPYELAARGADIVYVTPDGDSSASTILQSVRDAESRVGRVGAPLHVYADLLVLLDDTEQAARDALARLDDRAESALESDAVILPTTVDRLVERIRAWQGLGYAGFRLRPARLPQDLDRIAGELLPALEKAGLHSSADGATFRERLGLAPAPNRYATTRSTTRQEEVVV